MKFKTRLFLAAPVILLLAQLVRPTFDNPPPVKEPAWDSPATRALAQRACFDCHSHEAKLPWYGQIAPVRWMLVHHLHEGRENLDFQNVDGTENAKKIAKEIREGEMPMLPYTWMHKEARLSPSERDSLIAGLERTFSKRP